MKKFMFILSLLTVVCNGFAQQQEKWAEDRIAAIKAAKTDSLYFVQSCAGEMCFQLEAKEDLIHHLEIDNTRVLLEGASICGCISTHHWLNEWKGGTCSYMAWADSSRVYVNNNILNHVNMFLPTKGDNYKIEKAILETSQFYITSGGEWFRYSSILFRINEGGNIVFKRLRTGSKELEIAEGWTNYRSTVFGDSIEHYFDWLKDGKLLKTELVKTDRKPLRISTCNGNIYVGYYIGDFYHTFDGEAPHYVVDEYLYYYDDGEKVSYYDVIPSWDPLDDDF